MKRVHSPLGPAVFLAVVLLAATALAKAARPGTAALAVAPLLLALGVLGADLVRRRAEGRWRLPSAQALVGAAAILVASALVASADPAQLASWIPILGGSVALPVFLVRERACS